MSQHSSCLTGDWEEPVGKALISTRPELGKEALGSVGSSKCMRQFQLVDVQ